MMNAMRQAVVVSRMREGSRMMGIPAGTTMDSELSIDWKEALFLATRGGALALGLQGMFAVGLPFDAQESELNQFKVLLSSLLLLFCHSRIIRSNFWYGCRRP